MAAPKPVRAMNSDRIKIFTGTANPKLAEDMCECLGLEIGACQAEVTSRTARSTCRSSKTSAARTSL